MTSLHTLPRFATILTLTLGLLGSLSAQAQNPGNPPYVFTTLANVSSVDGTLSAARYNAPSGLAIDSHGNLFIADTNNHTIRKITPGGLVSTFAGLAGAPGVDDATGTAARFFNPSSVAVDRDDNLYVADTATSTIRKISPAGVVTTFAGAPYQHATKDGIYYDARFSHPTGVTTDRANNVYVADAQTVRKISPSRVVSTLAGLAGAFDSIDGIGSQARFGNISSVTTDALGNIYASDTGNATIRKITPTGVVTTLAGTPGNLGFADGIGPAATFYYPRGIAADNSGNLYIADAFNDMIRKISPAGAVTSVAGSPDHYGSNDGVGSAARFNTPCGIATDAAGTVYVADTNNNTIRKIIPAGVVLTLSGQSPAAGNGDGTIPFGDYIQGVAIGPTGDIYAADTYNHLIRKISPTGIITTLAGIAKVPGRTDGPSTAATFNLPESVTVDAANNVYVADKGNQLIRKISPAGVVSTFASSPTWSLPTSLALDPAGNLYVADYGNHIISKVTPTGVVSTLAGLVGASGSTDGQGEVARFTTPHSLTVDATGNVFVADTGNNIVRKITPAGLVTTLAGKVNTFPYRRDGDGTGSFARFVYPNSISIDGAGNLYVIDIPYYQIRKITPTGVVTTVAGSTQISPYTNYNATRLDSLAADAAGNLIVSSRNSVLRAQLTTSPGFTQQPVSQTVTAGGTVVFTCQASGVPAPTYQWNFNGNALAGATSPSLTITNAQAAHGGNYSVTATNTVTSVLSSTATLTVTPAPVTPPPPSGNGNGGSSGGGGGGAPSAWFSLALASVVAARHLGRRCTLIK